MSLAPTTPSEIPLPDRGLDGLLEDALAFHGHLCPGLVLGARMAVAGCRAVGLDRPWSAGKGLVVFVEIDRCATDAIQAVTGVTLGKRTLKHLDYGKMAATFVNVPRDVAYRVSARDEARELATAWAPGEPDARKAQTRAYRIMPEATLFRIEPVVVDGAWLDRRRARVFCEACGEGINYRREVTLGGRTLCRPCTGERYCTPRAPVSKAEVGRSD